ncbi:MAG TPA: VWA domain-containing protein [Candidatus Acidoferrales bacterium]|jgi:VWFA-related protein|nr:VWA domain-containing protein [Candidatus Acidoferrales bacterium]
MKHTMSKIYLAAFVAANLALAPLPASAQQQPPGKPTVVAAPANPLPTQRVVPQSPGTLRAESELVRIDVEVTDRSGNPIKGLREDQFTVTDNGKPQKISSFSYSDIESVDTAGPDNSKPVVIPVDGGAPSAKQSVSDEVRDRRMIVLFFDLSSMETDDITRAHDSAEKFLDKQMTPADLVSVVVFSTQLSVLANFTNNRAVLKKAVEQILPGAATQLAENQYAAAQNGEYDVQQDTQAAYTPDQTEFNVFNTDQKLIAVEDLTNVLAGIPGRKALVEFTGGITQTGEENRAELTATTDAANRADVSIYSIDARGMFATPPGGDATSAASTGTSMFSGASVFHQTDQREDSRDTLATLSTDTGGRAFFDLGDLSDAFPKIQQENGGYYLVGYNIPPDVKHDGRWRAVAVKVKASGVHVRYRNGYYAPRDFQHLEKEDKEQQLEDALESPNPDVELPVAVETAMFRLSDEQVYVPISAKLSSSALEWAQKHDLHTAEFDFAAEVKGVSGQTVAALRDTITVHLDEQQFQQVGRSNLVYQGGVVLSPGVYRLKFVARENESGKMGTFENQLVVPQRPPSRMTLSSVMLSSQLVPVEKTEEVQTKALGLRAKLSSTPLEMDGSKIVPSVTRYFTQQQTLYIFFQAYYPEKGADEDAFDANTLRAGLVFFRGGVQINATPLLAPTALDPKTHTASFRISLPLAKLPTGRYTVQAVVIAAGTQQSAFGRAYLALAQAEAAPNPAAAPSPATTGPGQPAPTPPTPR